MKRLIIRSVFCLALSTGVTLSTVAPALAHASTLSAKHAGSHAAGSTFRAELRAWSAKRHDIATTFRAAVASARSTFDSAKARATTSADRYAAITAFAAAIALAAENRSAALIALGPAPSNPNATTRSGTVAGSTKLGISIKKNRAYFDFHLN